MTATPPNTNRDASFPTRPSSNATPRPPLASPRTQQSHTPRKLGRLPYSGRAPHHDADDAQAICAALRDTYLRHRKASPDTLLLHELGLLHARARIDLAVIGRQVHGYEIKGAKDTLSRLHRQVEIYRLSLHALTLVVAPRHSSAVAGTVPDWCGILHVYRGPRGAYRFRSIRRARPNPDLDPFSLAHLLWRGEVQAALAERGVSGRDLRRGRKDLYRLLLETISLTELTELIRRSMFQRRAWRDLPQPS